MKYKVLIGASLVSAYAMVMTPVMADANGEIKSRDLLLRERQDIQSIKSLKPSASLNVEVKTDKKQYSIGEIVVVSVRVSQNAYVTVTDYGTSGNLLQILPNAFNNSRYIKANRWHRIPPINSKYEYVAGGPAGTELVKVIVSTNKAELISGGNVKKGKLFGTITQDPKDFSRDLKLRLKKEHSGQAKTAQIEFEMGAFHESRLKCWQVGFLVISSQNYLEIVGK